MNTIEFQSKKIKVVKSRRNKYLRLSVTPQGEIKLSAPLFLLQGQIMGFLEQQVEWLESVLAKLPASNKLQFQTGEKLFLLDREFDLVVTDNYPGATKAYIDDSAQRVFLFLGRGDGSEAIKEKLNIALRKYARAAISGMLPEIAEQMGVSYQNISVREQRSRWGSCSSNGNLSFNWKIVLAPESVFRYVLVHELAHIPQPNHSKHFWALVAQQHPHYRQDRAWLKHNASSLEIL
jgi:predicted metal-dependent hydrolase